MKTLKMKTFGLVLTGRELGRTVTTDILSKLDYPVTLDFKGVIAMGSSFADEVVVYIAKKQKLKVEVAHANTVIRECLADLADEWKLDIKLCKR